MGVSGTLIVQLALMGVSGSFIVRLVLVDVSGNFIHKGWFLSYYKYRE